MITMTDFAVTKVKELITAQNREGSGLRVYVAGGGCSGFRYGMALDETPGDEDFIHDFDGLKIYIDPQSIPENQRTAVAGAICRFLHLTKREEIEKVLAAEPRAPGAPRKGGSARRQHSQAA